MKIVLELARPHRRRLSCALVASFAIFCATAPALATTLRCNPLQFIVGPPPTDPRYVVEGTTVEFGGGDWRIEHRLANGTIAARNSQYLVSDTSTDHTKQWRGRYTHNQNLVMIGEVLDVGVPHHLLYKEWLYDASKGNQLIVNTQADCLVVDDVNLQAGPSAQPAPIPQQPASDADAARDKLFAENAKEYHDCIQWQMKQIVPYSNEGAETIAQVIQTNCSSLEQRDIDLGTALFRTSRVDAEKAVDEALGKMKRDIVAEIVTFRAVLNKALLAEPKNGDPAVKKAGQGL